ncbi:MAG: hypothetical protein ACLGHL_02060 [Actinomycetota bacterium]
MAKQGSALRQDMNRNQMILVGVLFLALFLVILFMFILPGGDEAVDPAAQPVASPAATPTVQPEATPTPTPTEPGEGPVETFEVFARRDPFEPVIDLTAGGTSGGGAAPIGGGTTGEATDPTTVGSTGDGDGTTTGGTGNGDGGSSTGGDTSGGSGSGDGSSNVGGHRVKLIDVYKKNGSKRAQVQVDGTVYTVSEGEDFAENFRLLSISGECASMLFGDDQFTICEGEEILK